MMHRPVLAVAAAVAILATGTDARTSAAVPTGCLAPADPWQRQVELTLRQRTSPGPTISFGLPVPPGVVRSSSAIRVTSGGRLVRTRASVLLRRFDAAGRPHGIQALRIELPAATLRDGERLVIAWSGGHTAAAGGTPFDAVSTPSADTEALASSTTTTLAGQRSADMKGQQ